MTGTNIHPTALVDKNARIGDNVSIGPFSLIGRDVEIGNNTSIENHVTIQGKTKIGQNNSIGPYSSIGLSAQDQHHLNEPTKVEIGDHNDIREYVSIHRGTLGGVGITRIGSHNQLFVSTHFAHDTLVGDHCMFANATTLGGHVQIGSYVVTGGLSAMHQFCRVGDYAMVAGTTAIYQDVPPYTLCSGARAQAYGINKIGLERNGFSQKEIIMVQELYDLYFTKGFIPKQSLQKIEDEIEDHEIRDRFTRFIKKTKRGLISVAS